MKCACMSQCGVRRTVMNWCLLACQVASASALPQTGGSSSSATTYFDVAKESEFRNFRTVLQVWNRHHPHHGGNDFCVLGYAAGDGSKASWILWRQGKEIFHWIGGDTPLDTLQTIHLNRDVVASESDIKGSTFLVTEQWVAGLQASCDAQGRKVHFPSGSDTGTQTKK